MQIKSNDQVFDISLSMLNAIVMEQKKYIGFLEEKSPSHAVFLKDVVSGKKHLYGAGSVFEFVD